MPNIRWSKHSTAGSKSGDFAASDSFARLLYDSAVVAEGEPIADPREFTNRIAAVMEAALGAANSAGTTGDR